MYKDNIVKQWQIKLRNHFWINETSLDTILFADDQAVIAKLESGLQPALHILYTIWRGHNCQISTAETKVMAFQGIERIIEYLLTTKYLNE
jgi:hypothetical protein